jgi:hypothetical protein
MAQAGYTPIQLYYSTTAAAVPLAANLAQGELAINITDGKLYYENNSGVVTLLASAAGASGDVVGPASATDNAVARFDGTTGKLIQNGVVIIGDTGAVTGVTDLTASGSVTLSGGTANGVTYLNGSKVLTSGSALTFDGGSLGVGAVPYSASRKSIQIIDAAEGYFLSNTRTALGVNFTFNANNLYIQNGYAGYFELDSPSGAYKWFTAPSGLTGATVSFTQAMTLDASGNLGIGTSSPAGKLDVGSVSGAVTSGDLIVTTGSTSASVTVGRQSSTGSDNTTFNVRNRIGTSVLYVDTGGQNVGIGTSSPSNKLSVSSSAGGNVASFTDTSSADLQINLTSGVSLLTPSTGILAFGTSSTERARINSSGQFGVGTSSPSAIIHSSSSGLGDGGGLRIQNTGSGGATFSIWPTATVNGEGAGKLIISGPSGNVITTTSAGNVGIGTTAPSAKLDVNGSINYPSAILDYTGTSVPFGGNNQALYSSTYAIGLGGTFGSLNFATTSAAPTTTAWWMLGRPGGADDAFTIDCRLGGAAVLRNAYKIISSGTDAAKIVDNHQWYTNGSERARIDSSGNLLVNTSTTSAFFDGKITSYSPDTYAPFAGKQGSSAASVNVSWNAGTTGDNIFEYFVTEASPTVRGTISYNRAGGLVAYNVTSDYRAKDIIGPVTNSGALIDSVPVYMGKMKDATQERPMFIAHETPAYAHTGVKDAVDKDGNPVYQQMDASALIPVMWAEIQSLRKRLADAGIA